MLILCFSACLIVPELEAPGTDGGDGGNSGGDGGTDAGDGGTDAGDSVQYGITVNFDTFVNSQFAQSEMPDEIKLKFTAIGLYGGGVEHIHTFDEVYGVDLKDLLISGQNFAFMNYTLNKKDIFDKLRLFVSDNVGDNYIIVNGEQYDIKFNEIVKNVNYEKNTVKSEIENYFEFSFNPRLNVEDCKDTTIMTKFDLKRAFRKEDTFYKSTNSGLSADYSCTAIGIDIDYQVMMGFGTTLSDEISNPFSHVKMNIIGIDLVNDSGSTRYYYAEPQSVDLIDTVLAGNLDIIPLVVESGLYDKVRLILSDDSSDNYIKTVDDVIYNIVPNNDSGELYVELNLPGQLDLLDCKYSYLTTTFDLNNSIKPNPAEESTYVIDNNTIDTIISCKQLISDNVALTADGEITSYSDMVGTPPSVMSRYKTYSKVIDGKLHIRTDYEASNQSDSFPITSITNGERTQTFNTDTGEIMSDMDINDYNEKNSSLSLEAKELFVKNKLSLCLTYDIDKFVEGYENNGFTKTLDKDNADIVTLNTELNETQKTDGGKMHKGFLRVSVSKSKGVIEEMESSTEMELGNNTFPVTTLTTSEYVYYGQFMYLKRKTTEMTMKMSLNETVMNDELAQHQIDKYKDFDFDGVEEISPEEFEANKDSYSLVPEMEKIRKMPDANTKIDMKSYSWENVTNIKLSQIDDKFFMFK